MLPIGVYACDIDGQILRVNRCAICGSFHLESLKGDLIPPGEIPMARAVLAGESFEGVEAMVQNPDGKCWAGRSMWLKVQRGPFHLRYVRWLDFKPYSV